MKKIIFTYLFILATSLSFSQNQRLVHRYFVQSSYKKDTALVNVAKKDQKVNLLIDSAEKYRKRILPKLILSGALYGLSLSQLPKEYAYINDMPLQDYRSMERRSALTLFMSGVVFFSAIKPILLKDYYIYRAYDSAHLSNPYIPYLPKKALKKIDKTKFKKIYLKSRIIKNGKSRIDFDKKVKLIYDSYNQYKPIYSNNQSLLANKYNYQVLDSNQNLIKIRCCNDFSLDYHFINNKLYKYTIDENVFSLAYNSYSNYLDSLKIQQQKRKKIIKSKR